MLSNFRRIEIELHSYCNRKCPWCPNSKIDRSFYQELPEDVFINLMLELKSNGFGTYKKGEKVETSSISFNRFCEPMANIDLLKKRINQAREILPYVFYIINTNGDFFTLENTHDLGMDSVHIMDYDMKGKKYGLKKFKENRILFINEDKEKGWIYGCHKTIGKVIYCYDWPKFAELEDRAGFFNNTNINYECDIKWKNNKEQRIEPCYEPTYYISIDYNGNVTPCCHIRADNNMHKEFIMGNIKEQSLSEIVHSDKWKTFSELVSSEDYTKYPSPCIYCNKTRINNNGKEDTNIYT